MGSKAARILSSILIGLGISTLSLFAAGIFLFNVQRSVLYFLLSIFFTSVIVFLVFWNIKNSKKVYFILLIPGMCLLAVIAIIGYQGYINNAKTVDEELFPHSRRYTPFDYNNTLAKPDEPSKLRVTGNFPVLDGATALYPVYASFVQAVYSEIEYEATSKNLLFCRGTEGAYNSLFEGKADIIFCAGPSETQLKQFNDNGIKLNFTAIGREAFVFFVNNRNPVSNLTITDIQGIYSGKIENWRELGWRNQNIRVFQRPKNSGSQTMLEKIMDNTPIMEPRRENVASGMGDIINQVAVYRNFSNAIGYSFLYFSTEMVKNNQIKLLSISGIYPSKETIQNDSYPFSDSFYAIHIETDEKNENIDLFIEWILSEQGQKLIEKTGYVPIRN